MKRIFEKIELEKWLSAVFGLIAIVAIGFEMKIADFEASAIAGGVKDIAGTIIAVVMLIVALEAFRKKNKKISGFQETFNREMEKIIKKYNPIITFWGVENTQKIADAYRYNIANKLDSITTKDPGGNNKFFRVKEKMDNIEFSVSATVFGDRKEGVTARIASRIKESYGEFVEEIVHTKEGFLLKLKSQLLNEDDAIVLSKIVDNILLLYIAEYKKL